MTPAANVTSLDTVMLLARLVGVLSIVASIVILSLGRVHARRVWQRSEHPTVFWLWAFVVASLGTGMIFLRWFVDIGMFR